MLSSFVACDCVSCCVNDTTTTVVYTDVHRVSLHDSLPITVNRSLQAGGVSGGCARNVMYTAVATVGRRTVSRSTPATRDAIGRPFASRCWAMTYAADDDGRSNLPARIWSMMSAAQLSAVLRAARDRR